jgi:hypothetical protein
MPPPPPPACRCVLALRCRFSCAYVFRFDNMRNATLKELRDKLHGVARCAHRRSGALRHGACVSRTLGRRLHLRASPRVRPRALRAAAAAHPHAHSHAACAAAGETARPLARRTTAASRSSHAFRGGCLARFFPPHRSFFLGSNKVLQVALGRTSEDEHRAGLAALGARIRGDAGLLFTNMDRVELETVLAEHAVAHHARTGAVAEDDFALEAGPLMFKARARCA